MSFYEYGGRRRILFLALVSAMALAGVGRAQEQSISIAISMQNQSGRSQSGQSQADQDQANQDQADQDRANQCQAKQDQANQDQASQSQKAPDRANQDLANKDQANQDLGNQGQKEQDSAAQGQQPSAQTPKESPPASDKGDNPNPAQVAASATKKVAIEAAEATKRLGEATLGKAKDWEVGWATGPYVGRQREMVAMTGAQRRDIYLEQTLLEPSDYFKRMFAAGIDQARGVPSQWGGGWGGYGQRFASREGQFIAANSLAALGNAKLKYEPRYDQCRCRGLWPRTRHAVMRNFLTYNETERELRPQWALYGGAFAGGVIATSWKPHPRNALVNGGFAVLGQAGYGALLNFFVEFAGDINRKIGTKR